MKAALEQREQLHQVFMGEPIREKLKVGDISDYFFKITPVNVDT
jgi:hypothetical protein